MSGRSSVNRLLFTILTTLCMINYVFGDCYMQYPPGSNDRLNEANADRQNGNRLFRSENNARGGYCWGPSMHFYTGSILPIQWTAQHGCNSPNVECNFVIQYMCSDGSVPADTVRDGDGSDGVTTIPDDATQYNKQNNGKYVYGMHESYEYYQDCKQRQRNKGLFLADQRLNGDSARFTRQEPNAGRYGFECNEEEQYYPYWHPSPWKDIAVLSSSKDKCAFYQAQSQNVLAKNYCKMPAATAEAGTPNNEAECVKAKGTWMVQPAWGTTAPDCQVADYSRDNHLGNGADGQTASYNWTIPSEACAAKGTCACALRIRYNISTGNTDNWGFNDYRENGANSPVRQNTDEYVEGNQLTLALNTNQYGRTFQDRSHTFSIVARPDSISASTKIYNLGVRGKRGNIVQTFPATEYDFVPTILSVTQDDYVHFQWTGCDTNPAGNAGEGIDQTDRSNIVQVDNRLGNIPLHNKTEMGKRNVTVMFDNDELRHHMAYVGQTNCPTIADLLAKNNNNKNKVNVDPTNCAKLNAAPAYFNGGLIKFNNTGNFSYMSTRNNNFSNRSQKGTLIVTPSKSNAMPESEAIGIAVGAVAVVALIAGSVGFYIYGKKNPHSFAGRTVNKIRGGNGNNQQYAYAHANNVERQAPLLN